jgi:hypothetical protein
MTFRIKAWLVSQGLLIITACIIQFTFHREIQLGPILGTPTRDYWDIINNVEPEIPQSVLEQNLSAEFYDARLILTSDQILSRNLVGHRRAVRQEEGIRTALSGGIIVNVLYFFVFHLLFSYFNRILLKKKNLAKL